MSRPTRVTVSLPVVLTCVIGTMALGASSKMPCAEGSWDDLRQYRLLCYSDVIPLLNTEQLRGERLPFLDACEPVEGRICDEYPVVTMYVMRVVAWFSGGSDASFFTVNALVMMGFAALIAVMLYVAVGARALYFALAPSLFVYGTINWDLVAVAFATAGLLFFFVRRDREAGAALGLGAATKLYPALLAWPLIVQRVRERRPDAAIVLGWTTIAAWLLVNLPFAILASTAWSTFFRFNSGRPPDFDSLWYIACRHFDLCLSTAVVNVGSLAAFLVSTAAVWLIKARRHPDFPRWTLGLPLLVAFLLTNKVYSPQYGLWLLPWFALALPRLDAFLVFSLTDVAVFLTRFTWFARLEGAEGASQGLFEVMALLRAAALMWCVVVWIRGRVEPLKIERRHDRELRSEPEAVPT